MLKTLLALTLTTGAISALAQTPACNPEVAPEKCTIGEAYDYYLDQSASARGVTTMTSDVATDMSGEKVKNANRAVEVPDAFAGRIHNTYQDFLNLFGFAINKVDESENGQALTIRFNPIRNSLIAAGGNLTVSKPTVSTALENALPETGRTDVVSQLQKQMGDLDNLTWSASAALQSVQCELTREPSNRCYGRLPEAYRNLLSFALEPIFGKSPEVDTSDLKIALFNLATEAGRQGDLFPKKLTAENIDVEKARPLMRDLATRQMGNRAAEQKFFKDAGVENVSSLIDNQPQGTLTASYNAQGKYGGPEGTTVQFELQFGHDNINAIRAHCKGDVECLQTEVKDRLENGVNTLKWVLSAAYKRNNNWLVPKDLGLKDPITGFDDFKLDRNRELSVKAQGGFKLGTKVGDEQMRADFSLEGQRIEVGNKRTKNRWVAASTFTVPVSDKMSVPLTISYANKSEFLPEESQKFGMHIGITYRIPDMPGMKKK